MFYELVSECCPCKSFAFLNLKLELFQIKRTHANFAFAVIRNARRCNRRHNGARMQLFHARPGLLAGSIALDGKQRGNASLRSLQSPASTTSTRDQKASKRIPWHLKRGPLRSTPRALLKKCVFGLVFAQLRERYEPARGAMPCQPLRPWC